MWPDTLALNQVKVEETSHLYFGSMEKRWHELLKAKNGQRPNL